MAYAYSAGILQPTDARSYQWAGSQVGRDVGMAHESYYADPYGAANQRQVEANYQQRLQQEEANRQQAMAEQQMREQWEEQKKNNEAARQSQLNKSKAFQSMALGGFGGGEFGSTQTQSPSVSLYSSSGNKIGGSFAPFKGSLLG
jgi:hypothetical protein